MHLIFIFFYGWHPPLPFDDLLFKAYIVRQTRFNAVGEAELWDPPVVGGLSWDPIWSPALTCGDPAHEGHGAVGASPGEGHQGDQRAGAPLR